MGRYAWANSKLDSGKFNGLLTFSPKRFRTLVFEFIVIMQVLGKTGQSRRQQYFFHGLTNHRSRRQLSQTSLPEHAVLKTEDEISE
jgi:hypothetical protein